MDDTPYSAQHDARLRELSRPSRNEAQELRMRIKDKESTAGRLGEPEAALLSEGLLAWFL